VVTCDAACARVLTTICADACRAPVLCCRVSLRRVSVPKDRIDVWPGSVCASRRPVLRDPPPLLPGSSRSSGAPVSGLQLTLPGRAPSSDSLSSPASRPSVSSRHRAVHSSSWFTALIVRDAPASSGHVSVASVRECSCHTASHMRQSIAFPA
jgi:hypothetical protein